MRAPITLDLHIVNFNFPGVGGADLWPTLTGIAEAAEGSGFSSLSVMDHLHQIPPVGPPVRSSGDPAGGASSAGLQPRDTTIRLRERKRVFIG